MLDENKYQCKYLNSCSTNPNENFRNNERIPRFLDTSLDNNTLKSNYRRDAENILNSFNNYNYYPDQNSLLNSSYTRSRSRSPCFCDCHQTNLQTQPIIHCYPHVHHICIHDDFPTYNNFYPKPLNNEVNKINDDLFNEINELKREYNRIKNELERTKNENDASVSYIKELENEINNQNNILMNTQKQNNISSITEKNPGRYHEMLNKSFEILDSVSNKCDDYKAKIHGDSNYYYNKEPEYNNLINAQKQWIDNLPDKTNNNLIGSSQSEKSPSNMFGNSGNFGDSNLNVFLNPSNNKIQGNMYNDINKSPQSGLINVEENDINTPNKNYSPNNFNNLFSDDKKYPNDNANNDIMPPSSNNQLTNIIAKNNNINQQKPQIKNNISPNKNINDQNINKQNQNSFNKNIPQNINNINDKQKIKNNPSSYEERCLIVDENGNPIYIEGQRLLGMEIMPLLDENGNEVLDDNGNILLIGPDGETKTQNDLEPIILDNDLPLVNEENKPFLGINGVPLINGYGNPILGPGELYDKNNNVVTGQLGIIPKDGFGNVIKVDLNGELIGNNNNNNNNDNENNNDNNENPKLMNLKPLIGKDGRPVRDVQNNPIMLDENNRPVKGTGISVLLDQTGRPVYNSVGNPILINREGQPMNLIDDNNNNEENDNVYPEKNNEENIKMNNINRLKNIKKGNFEKNKNEKNFPELNPEFQRKNSIKYPSSKTTEEINYFPGSCFACEHGCGVSVSGYSPMTYSPYNRNIKRRETTPLRRGTEYTQYNRHRQRKYSQK